MVSLPGQTRHVRGQVSCSAGGPAPSAPESRDWRLLEFVSQAFSRGSPYPSTSGFTFASLFMTPALLPDHRNRSSLASQSRHSLEAPLKRGGPPRVTWSRSRAWSRGRGRRKARNSQWRAGAGLGSGHEAQHVQGCDWEVRGGSVCSGDSAQGRGAGTQSPARDPEVGSGQDRER